MEGQPQGAVVAEDLQVGVGAVALAVALAVAIQICIIWDCTCNCTCMRGCVRVRACACAHVRARESAHACWAVAARARTRRACTPSTRTRTHYPVGPPSSHTCGWWLPGAEGVTGAVPPAPAPLPPSALWLLTLWCMRYMVAPPAPPNPPFPCCAACARDWADTRMPLAGGGRAVPQSSGGRVCCTRTHAQHGRRVLGDGGAGLSAGLGRASWLGGAAHAS